MSKCLGIIYGAEYVGEVPEGYTATCIMGEVIAVKPNEVPLILRDDKFIKLELY